MSEKASDRTKPESEDLDLGQLFQLIGKGLNRLFRALLRVFIYLKKRILILGILLVGGLAVGYGLSKIITKKQKIEVIVKPNLESKYYLYDAVEEVQANIEARNLEFFANLGIDLDNLKGFEIDIRPVEARETRSNDQMEYLELLQKFENTGIISDVLRAEILNRNTLNHRITILFKDNNLGPIFAEKVIDYLNSNLYFTELVAINKENAETRIAENGQLIKQIDEIINNYSKKLAQGESAIGEGRIVLESEEKVNVTGLFDLKNALIRDIESRKLNLLEQKEAISIINFGKPQQVKKSFFGKKIILIPTLLLLIYFLIDFIIYLNKRSMELQQNK